MALHCPGERKSDPTETSTTQVPACVWPRPIEYVFGPWLHVKQAYLGLKFRRCTQHSDPGSSVSTTLPWIMRITPRPSSSQFLTRTLNHLRYTVAKKPPLYAVHHQNEDPKCKTATG